MILQSQKRKIGNKGRDKHYIFVMNVLELNCKKHTIKSATLLLQLLLIFVKLTKIYHILHTTY